MKKVLKFNFKRETIVIEVTDAKGHKVGKPLKFQSFSLVQETKLDYEHYLKHLDKSIVKRQLVNYYLRKQ